MIGLVEHFDRGGSVAGSCTFPLWVGLVRPVLLCVFVCSLACRNLCGLGIFGVRCSGVVECFLSLVKGIVQFPKRTQRRLSWDSGLPESADFFFFFFSRQGTLHRDAEDTPRIWGVSGFEFFEFSSWVFTVSWFRVGEI